MRRVLMGGAFIVAGVAAGAYAQMGYTVLHSFTPAETGGGGSDCTPVMIGSTLYGLTVGGGTSGDGTLFSLNADGSGYTILRSFLGAPSGENPRGSLAPGGGILYGMTEGGGTSFGGTLFTYNPVLESIGTIHDFNGLQGSGPFGTPAVDGDMLYGVTSAGGAHGLGVVFSMGINGSGYQVLHDFNGAPDDGQRPLKSLLIQGDRLYGMTLYGGTDNLGLIYSIDSDGGEFAILHSFSGTDGEKPWGDLISSGGKLYGMTPHGGTNDKGVVFSLDPDGGSFTVLHHFAGGESDGMSPYGSLVADGSTLYGTTCYGGTGPAVNGSGTIFSINAESGAVTILHSFQGQPHDGTQPWDSLMFDGSRLFGTTREGGAENRGVIFSIAPPTATPTPTTTPTPTPPIDLTAQKAEFNTTDSIRVWADVRPIGTPCYPFVRVLMADGSTRYYERGRGFSASPVPYLGFAAGPITVGAPIMGYPALTANFSAIPTGTYELEGGAVDATRTTSASNLVYFGGVDREELTVR
jgi:uncharacterized repeat protein (TIGR03803 family)